MTSTTILPNATVTGPAVLKRRLGSVAIDFALVTLVWFVLRHLVGTGLMTVGLVGLLVVAVFGIVQGETGISPGKAFLDLKLVNEKGHPPGAGPALIRLAAWAIDGLPCFAVLGVLLIWFTPTHQRIGDTITRTFVVSSRRVEADPAQELAAPGPAPERYSAGDQEERQDFDPIWDSKVQAYVQWDPSEKRWVKYLELDDIWVPVDPL